MTGRPADEALERRSYAYRTDDDAIDRTIAFREVDLERDLPFLYAWFGRDHLKPYWQLDRSRPAVASLLAEKLEDESLTPYVGYLDHVPMSYWEVYRAADDVVAETYDARPSDLGIHLLVGPPEYLGHGYTTPLLRSIVRFQFETTGADRIVSEPDVRNDRAIRVFENCGFEPQRRIELPEKEAVLLSCDRTTIETRTDDA